MNKVTLIALVDALIEARISIQEDGQITPKRGLRGRAGKDFVLEDHKEFIEEKLNSLVEAIDKEELKLKFSDLTPEEKVTLRGGRGRSGRGFNFEEHREDIESILSEHKLTFQDFTEEEILLLKGDVGESGKDFSFEEHRQDIEQIIAQHKLKFEDLTEEEIASLRGAKGARGQKGSSFSFEKERENIHEILNSFFDEEKQSFKLNFSDLSEEERDGLRLKFEDLTKDQVQSLRGEKGAKGARGQKGSSIVGDRGSVWVTGDTLPETANENDMFFDEKTCDVYTWTDSWNKTGNIKGEKGDSIIGPMGLPGLAGRDALPAIDGLAGKDAPYITSVEVETNRDNIYFLFYFSDGSLIETNDVKLPKPEQIVSAYFNTMVGTGGGSGTSTPLEVYKDDTLVGETEKLNFAGTNITTTYDLLTKKTTVEVTEPTPSVEVYDSGSLIGVAEKIDFNDNLDVTWDGLTNTATVDSTGGGTDITVHDEGDLVTLALRDLDFVGEGVEVTVQTQIGDWVLLSDVTTMSGYEVVNPGHVRVEIGSPSKLSLTKIASGSVSKFDLVRLDTQTTATKANISSYTDSKTIGMALTDAADGVEFEVLVMGVVEDASFNFTINEPLFLQSDSTIDISATVTSGTYRTRVGQSYGTGAIFINIDEPVGVV